MEFWWLRTSRRRPSTSTFVIPTSMKQVRCWAWMETSATAAAGESSSGVWAEIQLRVPGFFEAISDLFPEEQVTIVFKTKPCKSPEISPPHNNRPDEKNNDDSQQLVAVQQQSLSESRLVEVASSSSSKGSSRPLSPRGRDAWIVINKVDPFTLEEVGAIKDPLLLHFYKRLSVEMETICVGLSGFEQYVQSETNAGRNLFNLELKQIVCKSGQHRNFILSKQVWICSILEQPKAMRCSFTKLYACALVREDQLDEMKCEKDFWKRIMVWITFSRAGEIVLRVTPARSTRRKQTPSLLWSAMAAPIRISIVTV